MANNVETMREALKFIKQYFDKIDPFNINTYTFSQIEVEHINEAIDAALARPLRECDVGTAEQQLERFKHQCFEHHTGRCSPHCRTLPAKTRQECALKWAQMPYTSKEGGAECT